MKITDEMVREASKAYNDYVIGCPTQSYLPHAMRAALEAALGVGKIPSGENAATHLLDQEEWLSTLGFTGLIELHREAAACIKDLAAALKLITPPLHGVYGGPLVCTKAIYEDGTDENTKRHKGSISPEDYYRARATLERWGLK